MNAGLYARRRIRSTFFLSLSVLATAFGLAWLGIILYSLLYEGVSSLSLKVLTEMTPPPGDSGGLANPLFGFLQSDTRFLKLREKFVAQQAEIRSALAGVTL